MNVLSSLNTPFYATGYILVGTGSIVTTRLADSNNNINVLATGAITTWNIQLPPNPWPGQIFSLAWPGGNIGTLAVTSQGTATIGAGVPTSGTTGEGGSVSLQYIAASNSWQAVNVGGASGATGGSSVGPLGFGTTLDMSGITTIINNTNGELTTSSFTSLTLSGNGSVTDIDVSYTPLATLVCSDDPVLASINASGATALTTITCHDDAVLSDIDLSGCTSLTAVDLQATSISSLDLTSNTSLTSLTCDDSLLSSLITTGLTSLSQITCLEHSLVGVDVSTNTALTAVAIYEGPLASINVSNNTALEILTLDENAISTLNIAANTVLTQVSAIGNSLSADSVDGVLSDLDANGLSNGLIDLSGGTNAAPTTGPPNGVVAKANLIGKGWTVTTN